MQSTRTRDTEQPLSSMSLNMFMRRMKAPVTVHGFRSSARMWMAEQGVAFELAEAALAHAVGNQVVAAYQRSSFSKTTPGHGSMGRLHLQHSRRLQRHPHAERLTRARPHRCRGCAHQHDPRARRDANVYRLAGHSNVPRRHMATPATRQQWQDRTYGDDSDGTRWTTSRCEFPAPKRVYRSCPVGIPSMSQSGGLWYNGGFQEFRHEPARSVAVSSTLDEDIKNEAILIDRAPKPVGLARDADGDLIQMPFVAARWSPLTDLAGERLPEFDRPFGAGLRS